MMSQSDFHKNAGRWGGSDVATRHYRAAVLSNDRYADIGITVIGLATSRGLTAISGASGLATKVTPWKNWSPNSAPRFCPPISI